MSPGGPGAGEPRTEGPGPIPSPVLHPLLHATGCRGSAPRPGSGAAWGSPRCSLSCAACAPRLRPLLGAGVSVHGVQPERAWVRAGPCQPRDSAAQFGCNALLAGQGLGWLTAARQRAGCPSCPLELPKAVLEARRVGDSRGGCRMTSVVERLEGLAWFCGTESVCCRSCCRYLASWLLPPIMGPL